VPKGLGNIQENGVFLSGTKAGRVDLNVVDQRFLNNTAHADIYVVEPYSIQLELADITETYKGKLENSKESVSSFSKALNVLEWQKSWILVEGKTYLVKVYMFDQDHNQILLGPNVEFAHVIDTKFLNLIDKNLIGSELILQAVKHEHGHAPITAHKTIFSAFLKEIKTT
jgi:hypothetical protein